MSIKNGPHDKAFTYKKHWGYLNYKGKIVLDLGCDWGSSCYYFIDEGAKFVIGIDCNKEYIQKGLENKIENSPLILKEEFIDSADKIEKLIEEYKPDIVKVDIEGAEKYILDMNPNVILKVKEWIIEIHEKKFEPNNIIVDKKLFLELFTNLGYTVKKCNFSVPVYTFRKE